MKINDAICFIKNGKLDEKLLDIYVAKNKLDSQRERYIKLLYSFEENFGDKDISIISAPGRTEIGGNHTDHQNGIVLSGAINLDVISVTEKTDDNFITIISDGRKINIIRTDDLEMKTYEKGTSESLVKGVLWKLNKLGYKLGGFNAYMTSDVLIGSGLSSSAAFENLIGSIISELFNSGKIDPVTIAKTSQFAEKVYYGKPCGLMDQMASSIGGVIKIDFKDTENPEYEKINFDLEKYKNSLCIIDTKASHEGLTDEYSAIPYEMGEIAQFFGKNVLREVDEDLFYENINVLREKFGDRAVLRTIHFFQEDRRVINEVKSLLDDDFESFKYYFKKSANSSFKYLQNIYSSSNIENQSVSLALAISGKHLQNNGVARVHGGGFAGTIQAFVNDDYVETYKSIMEKVFGTDSCLILKIRKYGTIKVL
ncbi:MAG: galactokinase family protein [Oscillospiraceae bacterium]